MFEDTTKNVTEHYAKRMRMKKIWSGENRKKRWTRLTGERKIGIE
jgi:hypothetical protein